MFLMEQCYFLFVFLQAFHELPWLFFSRLSQQNEEDKWVQWISLDFCRITMPSEILDPHPIKVVFKTQIGFTYNTVLLKESPTDQLLQMALDPTSHLPFTAASKIHPIRSLVRWLYRYTAEGCIRVKLHINRYKLCDINCFVWASTESETGVKAIGVKLWSQTHHGGG